jgi:hypothetical protein
LFFSPHSEVWIHSFPEALIAEALHQHGHEIVYVGCGGLLRSHCVAMMAHSIPFGAPEEARERICRRCRRTLGTLRRNFDLRGPDLMISAEEGDLAAAEALISSVSPKNYHDLCVEGIEVGRLALYEMVIQRKRGTLEFDELETQRYRAALKNVIVVLAVMKRIFDATKPDRVVLYNALYSVNRVVCRLAQSRGIPQYYLHAGDNLSRRLKTLVLARGHAFEYYKHIQRQWSKWRDRPCSLQAMQAATDHLLEVARGRSLWAYSAPSGDSSDLRKRFGVKADQRILCATMSSDDERFGGETIGVLPTLEHLLFPKQVDWIRALVAFVERRKDLFLLIRVHPREFPNKRERVLSEHAQLLQQSFVQLPENVAVNWPTDHISLYDLAKVTDVFANAWSSAGREMAWLGLPVVLYADDLTLYPPDLNFVGTTMTSYFEQIQAALNEGWNAERIRRAYRWCAVELFHGSLDIAESFSRDEHRPFARKAFARLVDTVAPGYRMERECRKRAPRLAVGPRVNRLLEEQLAAPIDLEQASPAPSYAEETAFLKQEVRRLTVGLYGPSPDERMNPLAANLLRFADS